MKTTTVIALSLALSILSLNATHAQSLEDDPLSGLDELFSELENLNTDSGNEGQTEETFETEDSTTQDNETTSESNDLLGDNFFEELETELFSSASEETFSADTFAEETAETVDTLAPLNPSRSDLVAARFKNGVAPAGKEHHLLYNIPGAIELNGMTFLNIDSKKILSKFQKCDTVETNTITNRLSLLKISQGAPLTCREDIQYQFAPYKSFRATR